MPEPRCDGCRYWKPTGYPAVTDRADDIPGYCRRYPATLNPVIMLADTWQNGEYDGDKVLEIVANDYAWCRPVMRGEDFCGEFSPLASAAGQ